MDTSDWEWDETLFAGSAGYYGIGRMSYPPGLRDAIATALDLDGTGRLLDVGCGPGSLTLQLAPLFESTVGVDADPEMIEEAERRSADIDWHCLRAEELPADLGMFSVVSFAQSFHWMDQPLVARRVRKMLTPDGAWIHVGGTTHRGAETDETLPYPRPPWEPIADLIADYLGPVRRAGRGRLPHGTRSGEETVMRAAGYSGPTRIDIDESRVVERGSEEIVAAVFSRSNSAPHLFADRRGEFESQLRTLLWNTSHNGRFAERTHPIEVVIWRV